MTTRIVIVGAGVAGYTAVDFLRKSAISQDIKIIWIAPKQNFTYKPFLFDVISTYRKFGDYVFSLKHYCERFRIDFIDSSVAQFLPHETGLILANGQRVNYEYMILATGEERVVDQALQSEMTFPMAKNSDIERIVTHLDTTFAAAKKQLSLLRKPFLSLVVSGSTLTSIEMLFAMYNYTESLRKKYDFRRNEISIAYVTPEKQFGGDIPLKLSDILEQYAKDHDIDLYIHQQISKIEGEQITINVGTVLSAHTVIVEGDAKLDGAFAKGGMKADDFGGLKINNYLQLEDFFNIYACGSLVNFYDWHKKELAWHSFNTAQAQAKVAASNVVAEIRGRNKEPYVPKGNLELIPVNDQLSIGVYGDAVYFNSFMHYTRMFLATKYLWQLTMPEE